MPLWRDSQLPSSALAISGRATMAAEPPLEPRSLFQMPTGGVVKSMDAEVSGLGVLFSDSSKPAIQAALGLGDIAQMEVGAIAIVSNLRRENELAAVRTAGLKVHVPLGTYARGVFSELSAIRVPYRCCRLRRLECQGW